MYTEKRQISETTDGKPPRDGFENASAPSPIDPKTGQHESYWVLSKEERAKGFVRPVRTQYVHLKCGAVTNMGMALSETYARDPQYYGATFCATCGCHFPVGVDGEFEWLDGQKVGT
jgi:hypothetical protein